MSLCLSWNPVTVRPAVLSGPQHRDQEEEERGGSVDRCYGETSRQSVTEDF